MIIKYQDTSRKYVTVFLLSLCRHWIYFLIGRGQEFWDSRSRYVVKVVGALLDLLGREMPGLLHQEGKGENIKDGEGTAEIDLNKDFPPEFSLKKARL